MKKPIILLINGVAESGKDLFIDTLLKKYFVLRTSIIDPVKHIARVLGWDGVKDERGRRFLAQLKTCLDEYDGFSFKEILSLVEKEMCPGHDFVCIVTREPDDIEGFKNVYKNLGFNVVSILIVRDSAVSRTPDNHADRGVSNYIYDFYIMNNKTIEMFESLCLDIAKEIYEHKPDLI
jgi:hypothetical protein